MSGLGRRVPTDWSHVEQYPLDLVGTTVYGGVLGINWYSNFDSPRLSTSGTYWIGEGDLGHIRGGHAIAALPYQVKDSAAWWSYYDQRSTSACTGYSGARMMTLLNRKVYDPGWLYTQAQLHDEWSDTPPADGSSVRAACDVLRTIGLKAVDGVVRPKSGIAAYRWATDWQDFRDALQIPDSQPGVPLLNSWGRDYPHRVRLTDEAGARLLNEDGELAVATDR